MSILLTTESNLIANHIPFSQPYKGSANEIAEPASINICQLGIPSSQHQPSMTLQTGVVEPIIRTRMPYLLDNKC